MKFPDAQGLCNPPPSSILILPSNDELLELIESASAKKALAEETILTWYKNIHGSRIRLALIQHGEVNCVEGQIVVTIDETFSKSGIKSFF